MRTAVIATDFVRLRVIPREEAGRPGLQFSQRGGLMSGTRWLVGVAALIATIALGFAGYAFVRRQQPEQCYACQRAIHEHSRTVALDHGRVRVFCCPACALTEHEQEGKPVRVTALTDFLTGAKLAPDAALIVKGSDVNMCARTHELVDSEKRAADVRYDRCSPSLLAFERREDATAFTREHGGQIVRFSELVPEFAR